MLNYTTPLYWSLYEDPIGVNPHMTNKDNQTVAAAADRIADMVASVLIDVIDDFKRENAKLQQKNTESHKECTELRKENTVLQAQLAQIINPVDSDATLQDVVAKNKQLVEEKQKLLTTIKELRAKSIKQDAELFKAADTLVDAYAQINYWQAETKRLEGRLAEIRRVIQGEK